MLIKKHHLFLLVAALCLLVSVTGIYGLWQTQVSVTNHLQVSDVDISLCEYELQAGRRVRYTGKEYVLPGDTISKIPCITNHAEPAYVRIRPIYVQPDSSLSEDALLSDQNLTGIGSDWIRQGNYYYYTKILQPEESVDFFHSVCFPASWTEDQTLAACEIALDAEAIQAANFSPDFASSDPWFGEEIEVCIHTNQDRSQFPAAEKQSLFVTLKERPGVLLAYPDDFFYNLAAAMPGDSLSDSVTITNQTTTPSNIFFSTSADAYTDGISHSMLEEIHLTLRLSDQVLYQGNLLSASLHSGILLKHFAPGESQSLSFELKLPASWNNKYALRETAVTWIFSSLQEETSQTQTGEASVTGRTPAKTHDFLPVRRYLFLFLAAASGILAFLFAKSMKGRKHR